MSLEGLDAPALAEAWESAVAEPGGWFWLKYVSRDEVELLKSGTDGADGMRLAALAEPDDSPLYGFIRFRRRSVLVKYVPEETSRVLKARCQVHFLLVSERFSPHDSTVTISSPTELTDAGLNSSCSTHTATASISSSSSSLRQKRLADIAESADEDQGALSGKGMDKASLAVPNPGEILRRVRSGGSIGHRGLTSSRYASAYAGRHPSLVVTAHDGGTVGIGGDGAVGGGGASPSHHGVSVGGVFGDDTNGNGRGFNAAGTPVIQAADRDPGAVPESSANTTTTTTTTLTTLTTTSSSSTLYPSKDFPSTTTPPTTTTADAENNYIQEGRRKSTSSASTRSGHAGINPDIYNHYPYVPKPKLGPRPHVEVSKRPHTASDPQSKAFHNRKSSVSSASSVKSTEERRRAAVPSSVRIKSLTRTDSLSSLGIELPQPPTEPLPPSAPSVFSLPNLSDSRSSIHSNAESTISPEKARLMRALQLRKQQKEQKKPEPEPEVPVAASAESTTPSEAGEEEEVKTPTATATSVTVVSSSTVQIVEQTGSPKNIEPRLPVAEENIAVMNAVEETTPRMPADVVPAEGNVVDAPAVEDAGTPVVADQKVAPAEDVTPTTKVAPPQAPAPEVNLNATTPDEEKDEDEVRKVEGQEESKDDELKEDAKEDTPIASPVVESIPEKKKEEETSVEAPQSPVEAADNTEGTKVRDDVSEADAESIASVEPPAQTESTPVAPRTPSSSSIASPKSEIENPFKREQSPVTPPKEPSAVDTSRSVSAPFLASDRGQPNMTDSKPPPRKVPLRSAGSVANRIKQFQQLTATPAPVRTPSRGNSPTPEWAAGRSFSGNETSPGILRKPSYTGASMQRASSSASQRSFNLRPQTPSGPTTPSDELGSMLPPPLPKQRPLSVLDGADDTPKVARAGFVEVRAAPQPPMHLRRISRTDISLMSEPRSPPALTPEEEADQKYMQRRSMDIAAEVVQRRDSQLSEAPKERSRLFSRSSNKDPAEKSPGFLRRISSSFKKEDVAAAPKAKTPPPPPVPEKKTYAFAGWLNVQLPDTMLWRRRCLKIDTTGWMFLSLTEDENAPMTRKYYIPGEIRSVDIPDIDEQELPHSVRLGLREGGTLQCACQNAKEVKEVMGVIRACQQQQQR